MILPGTKVMADEQAASKLTADDLGVVGYSQMPDSCSSHDDTPIIAVKALRAEPVYPTLEDSSVLPRPVTLSSAVPATTDWNQVERAVGCSLAGLASSDRQWLTVAALHRSGLYENPSFQSISPACLSLLQGAGKAMIELELRRAIAKKAPALTVAQRDQEAARTTRDVRRLLVRELNVADQAILGTGEAAQLRDRIGSGGSARTLEDVGLQVAGWWSLVLDGVNLREFVDGLYLQASVATAHHARTLFDQHFGALGPQFAIVESGPDHRRVFTVTVTTRDGRRGEGTAPTKKGAQQLACQDFLSRHAPRLMAESERPARSRLAGARHRPRVDERCASLAATFGCKDPQPFARALIHGSWAYENTAEGDTERDSNARLANLGSHVVTAALMRFKAALLLSQTTDPDPDVAVPLVLPDASLRPAFDALGLRNLARLGRGQQSLPFDDEMAANMVQAVFAASHIQWPDHVMFERHLPPVITRFLASQASTSLIDPVTRLQELATEFGIATEETRSRTGPDHRTTYHIQLEVRGLAAPVTVQGEGSSQRAARKAAAASLLETSAILAGDLPETLDNCTACLLLKRQFDVLDGLRSRWPRWQRQGRLAVPVLWQEPRRFDQWAARVEDLLTAEWRPDAAAQAAAADYYQQARRSARQRPVFTETLSRVTDWVAEAARQADLVTAWDEPIRNLAALAGAHSVWMSSGPDVAVEDIVSDWMLLYGRRLHPEDDVAVDGAAADAKTAAALRLALNECAGELPGINASRILVKGRPNSQGCTVVIRCRDHSFAELEGSAAMRLLCEAAPQFTMEIPERHAIGLNVKRGYRSARDTWLMAAAHSEPEADAYDHELARLIHDLKNEVTAAQVAAQLPAVGRTERLAAQQAASEHLDRAAELASRLRDTNMLYSAADLPGTTDLTTFIRAYVSDLIRRMPANIRIVPPVITPAVVAIDHRALRMVLDNLVKNAQEAMEDGGEITIDYTASLADEAVLLELADSGSGIPNDVVEAFEAGRPTASRKREGSGLGLLGVRRILRRAGGDLELTQRVHGTAWLATLPLEAESDQLGTANE